MPPPGEQVMKTAFTPSAADRATMEAMSRLHFESRIACPFSDAIDEAASYFANRRRGALRIPVHVGRLHLRLQRAITTRQSIFPDQSEMGRSHDALELLIHPLGRFPFPDLHALLTVRPCYPPGTKVALDLTYDPPLGIIGRHFDALIGRLVVAAAGRALLADVATFLVDRSREGERTT
jgi:hypothetical protein